MANQNKTGKVDVLMAREVSAKGWTVVIQLNLNPVPARWTFQMIYNDPYRGRVLPSTIGGRERFMSLNAPLDADKEDSPDSQTRLWISGFARPDGPVLPLDTLHQGVLSMIRELQGEERKAREGHEWVMKVMAAKDAKRWKDPDGSFMTEARALEIVRLLIEHGADPDTRISGDPWSKPDGRLRIDDGGIEVYPTDKSADDHVQLNLNEDSTEWLFQNEQGDANKVGYLLLKVGLVPVVSENPQ